jgi:UPF0042 nucleotide-binding protein
MNKLAKIQIISFGHKYGPAPAANLLLDVRFVSNPHYVDSLRPKTGLDPEVQVFLMHEDAAAAFLNTLKQMLRIQLPGYIRHGNDHGTLTIAFGCTGGKHRSVYFADQCRAMIDHLAHELDLRSEVSVTHRDLGRE